ncbi:hypothetical protein PYCCODRAFT_1394827 [Trametes coccinea BRFM310]|uniref:Actin-like ATPase domain-containing protein n=1 Tax=Trametes coccinea (strain BRFM310) TaxID=1353009 RepID=A0A1Y2IGA7_TRAC3|nr:hypothetical protein PYCCODRAFT_1394827 [Trametes coccinea BRFM310]
MIALKPYQGTVRKLVVAMDVGTTYSGVAYAILDPGEVPQIQGITRFPGQENAAGSSKIPSILYYRRDGTVHSAGAEAAQPGMELEAEDEDLVFVEWFKLHLRPERLDSGQIRRQDLPPLPHGKTVLDVFADFLRYLFTCTQRYISETHANGESLWSSLKDRIEFVLSHPNGWEGAQQGKMRQAAVMAGLVPDTPDGHERVHFVTEGEASLQFCVRGGLATDVITDGESVMIVDAGGGTVDISTYSFTSTSPLAVEEVASADCLLQGSTRVNVRAGTFLRERLKDSAYGNDEDIKVMLDYFDKSTKPIFKDKKDAAYIKFGTMKCNDPKVNIRRGQLTLTGVEMESFFAPCLEAIVKAVSAQRQAATHAVSTIFLVGGFAASPWLYNNLQRSLRSLGLTVYRPDTHTSKAVAEGAVSFYLEGFVSARVIKTTYGTEVDVEYDESDPEHRLRKHKQFTRSSGRIMLPDAFSTIISKGTRVLEEEERTASYVQETREARGLNSVSAEIMAYRGAKRNPCWEDLEPECFTTLCTVFADTSKVFKSPRIGPNGSVYYAQRFDVVLMCGLTELKAQIRWMENGEERRGPAKIVYDDDIRLA